MDAPKIPVDRIAAYVRMHRKKYGDAAIRTQLAKQGVPEADIATGFKIAVEPPGYVPPTAPPFKPSSEKSYIMVVDDDPAQVALMEEKLGSAGYRVTTASDAVQPVIQARAMKLALIISDMMMPGFGTGADALKALRAAKELPKTLPVIFATGSGLKRAYELIGEGDPYVRIIGKPIDWNLLQAYIRDLTGWDKKL